MMISELAIAYLIGLVAVVVLVQWAISGEPTAHGQIVGTQIGCLIALVWPLALLWFALIGAGHLVRQGWSFLRRKWK